MPRRRKPRRKEFDLVWTWRTRKNERMVRITNVFEKVEAEVEGEVKMAEDKRRRS